MLPKSLSSLILLVRVEIQDRAKSITEKKKTDTDQSLEGVVAAITALENSVHTNAGVGSNLTLQGTVSIFLWSD